MKRFSFFILFFVCLYCLSSPVFSKEKIAPFSPKKGFYSPSLFESNQPHHGISNLFQNIAGLSNNTQHQIKMSYHQDFFSYDEVNVSYLLSLDELSLGFGYQSFYTHDIQRTEWNSSGSHGVGILDQFSDIHTQAVVGVSYQTYSNIALGSSFHYFNRTLDTDSITYFSADVGILYRTDMDINVGFYTQNLFQTSQSWKLSGATESWDKKLISQLDWTKDQLYLKLSSDFDLYRILGNWSFNENLIFTGDAVFEDKDSLTRYGYGLILTFKELSFQYTHLSYTNTLLGLDQDLFGLLFNI